MLCRYIPKEPHLICWKSFPLDEQVSFIEELIYISVRDVRQLRSIVIPIVKVHWRHQPLNMTNWEVESDIRSSYPQLFIYSGISISFSLRTTRFLVADDVTT